MQVAALNLLTAAIAVAGVVVGMFAGISFGKHLERTRIRRIVRAVADKARSAENRGELGSRLEVPGIMRLARTLFSVEEVP